MNKWKGNKHQGELYVRGLGQAAREEVIPVSHTHFPSAPSLRLLSMAECVAARDPGRAVWCVW